MSICNVYCFAPFLIICYFNIHNVVKQVVRNWLYFLPLKHDIYAARSAHELLSRLIRRCYIFLNYYIHSYFGKHTRLIKSVYPSIRSDADLFGTANVNLPKIISVVREVSRTNFLYIVSM
jgi:hypothetical protein